MREIYIMNALRFQAREARRILAVTALVALAGIGTAMPSFANESYDRHVQEDCAQGPEGSWLSRSGRRPGGLML